MDLITLCLSLGLNFQMLKDKGFSDDEIKLQAENLQKIKSSKDKFWSFKLLDDTTVQTGELVLYGEISDLTWFGDEVTPKNFDTELKALGAISTLNVRINSPGGDVFAGQAIYSMLKRLDAQVNVYVDGVAASVASLIAMAGNRVIMPKNAMMMIHNPWGSCRGDSKKMRKTAEVLDKVGESVITTYMDKTGKSKEEILAIMDAETWLTAQECIDAGFADEIEDTEISMSLNDSDYIINGIKFNTDKLPNFNNAIKPNVVKPNPKERENQMNLLVLCQMLGLDYQMLSGKGFTDPEIQKMADELQLKMKTLTPPSKPELPKTEMSGTEQLERIVQVKALCDSFNVKQETVNMYIKKPEYTVDKVKSAILEDLKTRMPAVQANQTNDFTMGEQEQDKIRNAASDAILMRSGVRIAKPAEGAQEMRSMSMKDIAVECAMRDGITNAHRLSDEQLFKMATTPDSQFGSIVTNTVNKSMANAYNVKPPTYQAWCSIGSNPDFKATSKYQISEAGALERIGQSGEVKFDEMSDNAVTTKVISYAKGWGFSRQAMINDDIGVLTKIPMAYVRAALRGRNKLVYACLGTNANITQLDKKGAATTAPIFSTSAHANLAGTGSVISTASLSAARTAMRVQKNLRGLELLNITPKYLLVPANLEVVAGQFLRSTADPSAPNSGVVNIYQNSMDLIVDAELDSYNSAKGWYLASDPLDCETIEVTHLNGNEMPILETENGFSYVGMRWRILDDFAVTPIDYRGLYSNTGA